MRYGWPWPIATYSTTISASDVDASLTGEIRVDQIVAAM